MTDRQMLENAALAAGQERSAAGDLWSNARGAPWNPLTDDGDALRLAVKLHLQVIPYPIYDAPKHSVIVRRPTWNSDACRPDADEALACEPHGPDPAAATRRAIVRAAASIGAKMRETKEG